MNPNLKFGKIPIVLFILLFVYLAIIMIFAKTELFGDEAGYSHYAENITNGYYADSNDANIWWEPGYPLILALFKFLHFPVIVVKLFNAIFYFFAVVLFYKILLLYTNEKKSLLFAFILGIFPTYARPLIYQNSEPFSCFLICIIFYYSILLYRNKSVNYKNIFITGITIGYLALTKAIFGYVIVTCIIILIISYIFAKNKKFVRLSLLTFIISFIFCLPYLFYTYHLTGKVFFWSNRGGTNLYHSTTPFEGEYGDWLGNNIFLDNPQAMLNHKNMLDETKNMKAIEKDERLIELGIENFKHHPLKFFYNWLCGIGRLMFNYPFSYTYQKPDTYFFILPNMFLFVFLFISIAILLKQRKMFPHEFSFIILFFAVYLGGISLVSTVARYTALFYPLFFAIILYVFTKILKIRIAEDETV